MNIEIRLPKLGLTMEEATVVSWEKQIGDLVQATDVIALVETDKATMEIEAGASGYLTEQIVKHGAVIAVGGILGLLSENPALPAEQSAATAIPGQVVEQSVADVNPIPFTHSLTNLGRKPVSPAARKLAREKGINPETVEGTGPRGRVVLRDIVVAANRMQEGVKATPVSPRINAASPTGAPKKLNVMRKTIAERLTYSFREIPQFQVKRNVNMTQVLKIRETLVNSFEQSTGIRLSLLDFVIQAVAQALKQSPRINVSFHTETGDPYILQHDSIHIGLAVALQDGLVVPIIRNTDQLSLIEIAKCRHQLVTAAKAGKLKAEDYTGGTFTVSSLASYDVDEFVSLINPPESGILAVGKVIDQPIVAGGTIQIAPMMHLNGTFDHRPLDGADGAQFMQLLVKQLESDRWIIV